MTTTVTGMSLWKWKGHKLSLNSRAYTQRQPGGGCQYFLSLVKMRFLRLRTYCETSLYAICNGARRPRYVISHVGQKESESAAILDLAWLDDGGFLLGSRVRNVKSRCVAIRNELLGRARNKSRTPHKTTTEDLCADRDVIDDQCDRFSSAHMSQFGSCGIQSGVYLALLLYHDYQHTFTSIWCISTYQTFARMLCMRRSGPTRFDHAHLYSSSSSWWIRLIRNDSF